MATTKTASIAPNDHGQGLRTYYQGKIEECEVQIREKQVDLRRMEAQRNELNSKGALSRSRSCLDTLEIRPDYNNIYLYLFAPQFVFCGKNCSCCKSLDPMLEK